MIEIQRLKEGDERAAIEAIHGLKPAEERDDLDASPEHMQRLLGSEQNYLYVASVGASPVGFLLAYRMPRVDRDQDMVYLYELGVAAEYRRRGIASKLVELLKGDCRRANVLEIWVGTGIDNEAARALFESTGARLAGETYAEFTYRDL